MKDATHGPLAIPIESYLAHKHSLGKQLTKIGQMLLLLNRHLLSRGVSELKEVTPAHIDEFVSSRPRHSPRSYNGLLSALRGFFDWMVIHELMQKSPLQCDVRRTVQPNRPFLFNSDQARRLLAAAAQLPSNPRALNRGETYKMLFALLYGLGLRVGEVSRLCRKDVDFGSQFLLIRQTKFGKDRLVPFGPRMAQEMTAFLEREESRWGPIQPDAPLFSFSKGNRAPVGTNTISWTFHKLLPALDLVVPAGVSAPHLHCLRHSFAVGTLLRWYRTGVDPMARLFDLSTFLGHVSPSSTAVYLTITMELLDCASERFGQFAVKSRKEGLR